MFAGVDTAACYALGALVLIGGAALLASATSTTNMGNTSLSSYQIRMPNFGRGMSNFWENVCVPSFQFLATLASPAFTPPIEYDYAPPIRVPLAPDITTDNGVIEQYPTLGEQGYEVVEPGSSTDTGSDPDPELDLGPSPLPPVPPVNISPPTPEPEERVNLDTSALTGLVAHNPN
ncbi:MAG: hypothetical protein AAFR67_18475, partial [Chloroflexota bacterium]